MKVAALPESAIRANLAKKGLSEADIEAVLSIQRQTNELIAKTNAKPTASKQEHRVIASMKILDHCPSCQADDEHLEYGYFISSANGSRFVVDDTVPICNDEKYPCKKTVTAYVMCPTCLNKEWLMTQVERLLDDPRNHPAFTKLVSTLGAKDS